MSAVHKQELEQAFPVIQEDDLFGGFSSNSPNMDVEDPFASTTGASDPFSAFNVALESKAVSNPFSAENLSECPASPNATSRTATPIDELQSLRSDEAPWPGNNTAETGPDTSRDSAALSGSSDIAIPQDHGCSGMDTSGSSASSGRAVPNIALDSDSGNLTADANENACLPNAIYTLIDPMDAELATTPSPAALLVPKITLTEATVISEKSSCVEAPEDGVSIGGGHSRLLDSSELDTSQDPSSSNIASISSHDESAAQVDNLSTMNISQINCASDGAESAADAKNTDVILPALNFFEPPESCDADEMEQDRVMESELTDEVLGAGKGVQLMPMPKTDRVYTSSPINPRRRNSVEERHTEDPLVPLRNEQQEKISSKDEKEKEDIEKLKEQAKNDLEEWYRERQERIKAQHVVHMGLQDAQYGVRTENTEKTIWQRMANLALELNQGHKVDEKRKDTSKMKYLLQMLAVKAPILNIPETPSSPE